MHNKSCKSGGACCALADDGRALADDGPQTYLNTAKHHTLYRENNEIYFLAPLDSTQARQSTPNIFTKPGR
jgi:hypothetical protein